MSIIDSEGSNQYSLSLPIAEIDISTGIITHASQSFCTILEKPQTAIVGSPISLYTMDEEACLDWHLFLSVLSDPGISIMTTKRFVSSDGAEKKIQSRYLTFESDKGQRSLVSILDTPAVGRTNILSRDSSVSMVRMARDAFIQSLVAIVQFRDLETSDHLKRTRLYVQLLFEMLADRFPLSRYGQTLIARLSMLHDIGKIGIADSILFKSGNFTADEYEQMKTHTINGTLILQKALSCTEYDIGLMYARDIIEFHHERWDGYGYPHGLKGEEIPFVARVMAVADVYDALRSKRRYKPAYSHEDAVNIIASIAGTQLDPEIVGTFLKRHVEFRLIEALHANNASPENFQSENFNLTVPILS